MILAPKEIQRNPVFIAQKISGVVADLVDIFFQNDLICRTVDTLAAR